MLKEESCDNNEIIGGLTPEAATAAGLCGGNFIVNGGTRCYLCFPKEDRFAHVKCRTELSEPAFRGTPKEFLESLPAELRGKVEAQMRNKVRVCACGKGIAYVSKTCNMCGSSVEHVPVTHTDNVFMAFVYGISGRAERPLKMSLRYQTPGLMVFDDLLSVSTCHFCATPTDEYIPDWRFLLRRPREGLALVRRLVECCKVVFTEQFLGNKAWAALNVPAEMRGSDKVYDYIEMGFNFPPSQAQLHMHYIYPQYLPFQRNMTISRNPTVSSVIRYFPTQYVQKALEMLVETGREQEFAGLDEDTDIDDVTGRIHDLFGLDKVDYYKRYYYDNYEANGRLFGAVWKATDFEGYGVGDRAYRWGCTTSTEGFTVSDAASLEKRAIGNYGRPLNKDGTPFGTYYKYPKSPAEVGSFFV